MAFGALKSHEFSERPTKSRILGSLAHARRSAARVSSAGTPGARNARISVSAVMLSIGGSFARSNTAADGSGAPPRAGAASLSLRSPSPPPARVASLAGAAAGRAAASCVAALRRDQRAMKFSGSLIPAASALVRAAPAPPDRRGHARVYGTAVGHGARRRTRRSSRARPPAWGPHRRDRSPFRSTLRPRR